MSERVTWEVCPVCGGTAAVGWIMIRSATGESFPDEAVEFDCPSACRPTPEQLIETFDAPRGTSVPAFRHSLASPDHGRPVPDPVRCCGDEGGALSSTVSGPVSLIVVQAM